MADDSYVVIDPDGIGPHRRRIRRRHFAHERRHPHHVQRRVNAWIVNRLIQYVASL